MGKKSNKELTKEIKEKSNKTFKEFKEFISKGNVIDLAVGVIIGGAFSKIVSSLVKIDGGVGSIEIKMKEE